MALSGPELAMFNSDTPFGLFSEKELPQVVSLADESRKVTKHLADLFKSLAKAELDYSRKVLDIVASSEASFPSTTPSSSSSTSSSSSHRHPSSSSSSSSSHHPSSSSSSSSSAMREENMSLAAAINAFRRGTAAVAARQHGRAEAVMADIVAPLAAFVSANAAKKAASAAKKAIAALSPLRDTVAKDERKLDKVRAAAAKAHAGYKAATEPDKRTKLLAQARNLDRDVALRESELVKVHRELASQEMAFASRDLKLHFVALQDIQLDRDELIKRALTHHVALADAIVPFIQETNWNMLQAVDACQPMADLRAFVLRHHVPAALNPTAPAALPSPASPALKAAKARPLPLPTTDDSDSQPQQQQQHSQSQLRSAPVPIPRAALDPFGDHPTPPTSSPSSPVAAADDAPISSPIASSPRHARSPRTARDSADLFDGLDDEPTVALSTGGDHSDPLSPTVALSTGGDASGPPEATDLLFGTRLLQPSTSPPTCSLADLFGSDSDSPDIAPPSSTPAPAASANTRNLFADSDSDDGVDAATAADIFGSAAAVAPPPPSRSDDVFALVGDTSTVPTAIPDTGDADDDFMTMFASGISSSPRSAAQAVATSAAPALAGSPAKARVLDEFATTKSRSADDGSADAPPDELSVLTAMLSAKPAKSKRSRSSKTAAASRTRTSSGSARAASSSARASAQPRTGASAADASDDAARARALAALAELADDNDYYSMLGVAASVSDSALASAFKRLQTELDPSRFDTRRDQRRASSRFQKINAAYVSVLQHKKKRSVYNSIVKLRASYTSLATPAASASSVRKALKSMAKLLDELTKHKMPTTLSTELSMAVRLVRDAHPDAKK
ncbi:uncharacterized protein AMSG_10446 [Thecamonas trahens ATCC 50062]|uniref:J domain-containing protein n=1 Tax=Thecamonas trahens ATCC 50062 TaxID=461836 RepID=A0A0L0DR10_THETB|nr:hypothetical protein AMSG_10446 [Thecamonas trahens ATCC 50062]KNC54451.1 hypothetical protein AMSG_10446 [Thecamonas trahens ATCC 50062]|eukprot:XP_013753607.1 hypothetical protein AMSG_10446 [Thecamonas trahens ATCC 50062]